MKTLPVAQATVTAFLGASSGPSGTWGLSRLAPSSSCRETASPFLASSSHHRRRSSSSVRMMHEVLTEVSPELVMQLAGCAVMVGAGKMLQVKEEEEGIEPAAPWALEEEGAEKGVDLYRDTAVRYFGYANEVGEAFRPLVPAPLVTFSYLVAFCYIAADSYSQGAKVVDPSSGGGWKKPSVLASIDSLLFQFMASVIFPSFTINRWVTFFGTVLSELPEEQFSNVSTEVLQYLPTATGLILIPIICAPLDVLTHRLLDNSFRSVSETILAKDR